MTDRIPDEAIDGLRSASTYDEQVIQERCEREWKKDPKLRGEFTDLQAYTAYKIAYEGGLARIYGQDTLV